MNIIFINQLINVNIYFCVLNFILGLIIFY
nr:MAG TPA: hypothetical protein [Bacteriophage sp.]